MNYYRLVRVIVVVLGFGVTGKYIFAGDVSGKSFFMPRSIGSDAVLLHAGSHHFIKRYEPSNRFFLSTADVFYQESTNNKDLRRYFFPCGKDCLQIKGAFAVGERDISATWLQIAGKNTNPDGDAFPDGTPFADGGNTTHENVELYLNEFESKITINPEFKRFGSIIQLYKNLDFISDRLWMSFDFPIVYVETNMHLKEFDIKNAANRRNFLSDQTFQIFDSNADLQRAEPTTLLHKLNATQALNNPLWKYGKMHCGVLKLAGLDDIHGKLGFEFLQKKSLRLSGYGNMIIPTGYKPTAEYMFEPIVGNGQHFGLGAGLGLCLQLIDSDDRLGVNDKKLQIASTLDYVYLFENTQKRSFDLKNNGQWSRYLLVVDRGNAKRTLQPGINFFTQDTKITPRSEINWTNSINFSYKKLLMETGYNFWYKSSELAKLKGCLPQELFIANTHFGTRDVRDAGDVVLDELFDIQSFSSATIKKHLSDNEADRQPNQNNADDLEPIFTKNIKACDLDLCSGRHPSRLSHTFYALLGLNTTWKKLPFLASIGGSYEFGEASKSLDLWSVWLKFSMNV